MQLVKVIQQQRHAVRTCRLRTDQIAAQHKEIDVVGKRRLEDCLRRSPRRIGHRVAQMRRQRIEITERSFKMKIAGMNESERLAWHWFPPWIVTCRCDHHIM